MLSKSQLPEEIEAQKKSIIIHVSTHPKQIEAAAKNGMIPCVFSQQVSGPPKVRYTIGWRFTKIGTEIGEVQQEPHNALYRDQTIEWVYEGPEKTPLVMSLEEEKRLLTEALAALWAK